MVDSLATLSKAGVSIWLDDLSRERLVSGSLADLAAHDHVMELRQIRAFSPRRSPARRRTIRRPRDLAARGVDVREALRALTTFDVRWACDVCGRSTTRRAACMAGY